MSRLHILLILFFVGLWPHPSAADNQVVCIFNRLVLENGSPDNMTYQIAECVDGHCADWQPKKLPPNSWHVLSRQLPPGCENEPCYFTLQFSTGVNYVRKYVLRSSLTKNKSLCRLENSYHFALRGHWPDLFWGRSEIENRHFRETISYLVSGDDRQDKRVAVLNDIDCKAIIYTGDRTQTILFKNVVDKNIRQVKPRSFFIELVGVGSTNLDGVGSTQQRPVEEYHFLDGRSQTYRSTFLPLLPFTSEIDAKAYLERLNEFYGKYCN
jgi:hypothetical protein